MRSLASPPYGQRLIPVEIDRQAEETPERLVYSLPLTNRLDDGFTHVAISTFANAINRAAWFLESTLGRSETFNTVGYLGPNDLRYQILTVALCKVGHKILLISPRNSIEGDLNVIDKASCSTWLVPSQHTRFQNITKIFAARKNMHVFEVPEASELLDQAPVRSYPFNKTFEQVEKDPLMVLHSSGSTGLPKPIVIRHGLLATSDAQILIQTSEPKLQTQYWTGTKYYCALPLFHAAGIYLTLSNMIYQNAHTVIGGDIPITPALIDYVIDHEKVEGMMLAASMIDEIVKTPSTYERLSKVKYIISGGGPPSQASGKKVSDMTIIDNLMGTTEGVTPPAYRVPAEDWQYNHFHPCNGFEYREYGNELYEQVQVRNPKYEMFQGYLKTFPELDEYSTHDLYAKHPTKDGFWIYRGRADDVIVLSNGEKVNPLDIESKMNDHPAIRSALVVGQARFQTTLLIELVDPISLKEETRDELMKSLWPFIVEANAPAPAHARIQEGFVIFANPFKPFLRAGKGTCQRAGTVSLYQPEIEEFYSKIDAVEYKGALNINDFDNFTSGLQELYKKLFKSEKEIDVEDDVFATTGFDSLSVITLIRQLKSILKVHDIDEEKLNLSLIYGNPSISSLAKTLWGIVHSGQSDIDLNEVASKTSQETRIQDLFQKYTADLPVPTSNQSVLPTTGFYVILTGSTGSLGSYILESLLKHPDVSEIYCLNRSSDAEERQKTTMKRNGFDMDFNSLISSKKVTFLHANLAVPNLGLPSEEYSRLLEKATHIIHNAWTVNFNMSLASFEPHIKGVRNLVDLCVASTYKSKIFFVSSVGVLAGGGLKTGGVVKEVLIEKSRWNNASMGYGESKLISEMILAEACGRGCGGDITICRIGQIGGPVMREEGVWNKWEWLPSLIISSNYLKCVPKNLGVLSRVDWIPVDLLADIILELTFANSQPQNSIATPISSITSSIFNLKITDTSQKPSKLSIYHTVNPKPESWDSLLNIIQQHIHPTTKRVELKEWINRLKQSAIGATDMDIQSNPAVKLVGFFEGLVVGSEGEEMKREQLGGGLIFETKKTREVSRGMRDMEGVGEEWMGRWLRQWGL